MVSGATELIMGEGSQSSPLTLGSLLQMMKPHLSGLTGLIFLQGVTDGTGWGSRLVSV